MGGTTCHSILFLYMFSIDFASHDKAVDLFICLFTLSSVLFVGSRYVIFHLFFLIHI